MKIYQLHKHGGAWELYHDVIIGSYVNKERAEAEKLKAKQEEKRKRKQSEQCAKCPYNNNMEDENLMAELMRQYCDHSDISFDDGTIFCKAHYYHWYDERFYVEEVEVIE